MLDTIWPPQVSQSALRHRDYLRTSWKWKKWNSNVVCDLASFSNLAVHGFFLCMWFPTRTRAGVYIGITVIQNSDCFSQAYHPSPTWFLSEITYETAFSKDGPVNIIPPNYNGTRRYWKTVIFAHFNLFESFKMLFGLKNAARMSQWFMDGTIKGFAYIGYVLITSSFTASTHSLQ